MLVSRKNFEKRGNADRQDGQDRARLISVWLNSHCLGLARMAD